MISCLSYKFYYRGIYCGIFKGTPIAELFYPEFGIISDFGTSFGTILRIYYYFIWQSEFGYFYLSISFP